jgi:thiol-disulfide isomerase/thioredoxin
MKCPIAIASASLLFALAAPLALAQSSGKPDKPSSKETGQPKEKAKKETKLKVGDPAPALKVDKWIKGDSVNGFDKGKVYVVEFWATWCPPCRTSIPHLTELQHKYKDVVFIGVDGNERAASTGTDNRVATIEKFVKEQGDKMDYRVAYDSNGSAVKPFMDAAGQEGIPTAFLINGEGKIAWIGHPMELEGPLAKVAKPSKDAPKDKEKAKEKDKKSGG